MDHQTLFNWLLGCLTALVGAISSRLWTSLEVLRKAHADAALLYVPRVEMQKHMDDLRVEMQRDIDRWVETALRMHGENLGRFDKIDLAVIRIADQLLSHNGHE